MIFELPIAAADLAGNLPAPNRHNRDQFASGYPPVPTLITGHAALAAGDAMKFIVYHCRRRLYGQISGAGELPPERPSTPTRSPHRELHFETDFDFRRGCDRRRRLACARRRYPSVPDVFRLIVGRPPSTA